MGGAEYKARLPSTFTLFSATCNYLRIIVKKYIYISRIYYPLVHAIFNIIMALRWNTPSMDISLLYVMGIVICVYLIKMGIFAQVMFCTCMEVTPHRSGLRQVSRQK